MSNRPEQLGKYEWAAQLRDGTVYCEFLEGEHLSIDVLIGRDVARIYLIPLEDGHPFTRLDIAPGEEWGKKWIRTIDVIGGVEFERDVIDCLWLKSNKPVYHHIFSSGLMVITSNPEPER